MDGNAIIALAGRLAAHSTADEATYRAAVSRAYYGAFHVARSLLLEIGFKPVANANVHAFVQQYLYESRQVDARLAAGHLNDLQRARNRADYDLDDPQVGAKDYAMVCVERAHFVASSVSTCRRDESLDELRQAIAEYERKFRPR